MNQAEVYVFNMHISNDNIPKKEKEHKAPVVKPKQKNIKENK
jgi:hypothetical protein